MYIRNFSKISPTRKWYIWCNIVIGLSTMPLHNYVVMSLHFNHRHILIKHKHFAFRFDHMSFTRERKMIKSWFDHICFTREKKKKRMIKANMYIFIPYLNSLCLKICLSISWHKLFYYTQFINPKQIFSIKKRFNHLRIITR